MLLFSNKNMNKLSQSNIEWFPFFDNFLKIIVNNNPEKRQNKGI